MSTLTSGDFGELKRPTTRVHAPPGGGSSWSIGGYQEPAKTVVHQPPPPPPVNNKPAAVATVQQKQVPAATKTPVVAAGTEIKNENSVSEMLASFSSVIRIGVIFVSDDSSSKIGLEQARLLKTNLCNIYGLVPSNIDLFEIPVLASIPLAAQKLVKLHQYDAIICVGLVPASNPLCASTAQALMELSVSNECPIVSGFYNGSGDANTWVKALPAKVLPVLAIGGFKPRSETLASISGGVYTSASPPAPEPRAF